MPKWLSPVLLRIRELTRQGFVRFTHKANEELKALGLDQEDALEIIAGLGGQGLFDQVDLRDHGRVDVRVQTVPRLRIRLCEADLAHKLHRRVVPRRAEP